MTPEQARSLLGELKRFSQENILDLFVSELKPVSTLLKTRIFLNKENADNEEIGKYGRYYSEKYQSFWVPLRIRFGLQVEAVDLKFTGALRDSIKINKYKKDVKLEITDSKNVQKVITQEHLQGIKKGKEHMDIFSLSNEEYGFFDENLDKALVKELDKILDKYA